MSDSVEVNGSTHSWGSIVIKFDGDRYYGFNAVSFGDKRTRSLVWGMGRAQAPRARSRGKYEPEASKIKGPVASVQALRKALAAKSANGKSYGDVEFECLISIIEQGSDAPLTVELQRCVWTSNSASFSEGPDGLEEEFEVSVFRILRDGLTLFDSEAA